MAQFYGAANPAISYYSRSHLDQLAYTCAKEAFTDPVLTAATWVALVQSGAELKDVFNCRNECPMHVRECANHLRVLASRLLRENQKFSTIEAVDLLVSLVLPDTAECDDARLGALAEFMNISNMDHELQQNMCFGSGSRHSMSMLAMQRDSSILRWSETYNMVARGLGGTAWRVAYLQCTTHKLYSFKRS